MNNKTLLGILFAVSVLALVATFLIPANGVRTIKAVAVPGIRYDSLNHQAPYEHAENATAPLKDLSLSMEFRPYSTKGFTELFQTAPFSRGARVELHEKIIGLVVAAKNPKGFDPYLITASYNPSVRHLLEVKIDRLNHVSAYLDHQQVVSADSPDLNYEISDVTGGGGFAKDRTFRGNVSNFSYSYTLSEPTSLSQVLTWTRLGLAFVSLVLLFLLSGASNFKLASVPPDVEPTEDAE